MNQWPLVSFSVVVTVEIPRFYKIGPITIHAVLDPTATGAYILMSFKIRKKLNFT